MSDRSIFKSRTGQLTCSPEELFEFVTDFRNLRQFISQGSVEDLLTDRESCILHFSPLGEISLKITGKIPYKSVQYGGRVLQSNDFSLLLDIGQNVSGNAIVAVTLDAEMNPILRMMATKPVIQFLETLICEMERFRGWNDVRA